METAAFEAQAGWVVLVINMVTAWLAVQVFR